MNLSKIKFKARKYIRKIKYWLLKRMFREDEWKTLRMIRVGYYGGEKSNNIIPIRFNFELDDNSHRFLHSAEGEEKYDLKFGVARQMLRGMEEQIANYISYTEAYDKINNKWICSAELDIVEVQGV